MLYAILSDIHSNLEALQACLRFLRRKRVHTWLILGDLVGYGPNPNEVIKEVLSLHSRIMIRGNHDRVSCGLEDPQDFNEYAQDAVEWTRNRLTSYYKSVLRNLPVGPKEVTSNILIAHGSPHDEDHYLLSDYDAFVVFRDYHHPYIFVGHTHIPMIFRMKNDSAQYIETFRIPPARTVRIRLTPGYSYIINPGSIGQPRDHISYLSFCLFHEKKGELTYYRLPYPIEKTQKKIIHAGLPAFLAHRLARGV